METTWDNHQIKKKKEVPKSISLYTGCACLFDKNSGITVRNFRIKLLIIMVIINVLIPKAGLKVSGIPITLGNLALLFVLMLIVKDVMFRKKLVMDKLGRIILYGIVYWLVVVGFGVLTMTGETNKTMYGRNDIVAYVISLSIYPLVFFYVAENVKDEKQIEKIVKIITVCLVITMLYAFSQSIFGIKKVTIPGITVNLSDYQAAPSSWWTAKRNQVGSSSSKIMSTYQNGNIYGANVLLFLPLVYAMPYEKKWLKPVLLGMVGITLFLTGCRTAFFGYIGYCLFLFIGFLKRKRVSRKKIIYGMILLVVGGIVFYQVILSKSDYFTRMLSALNSNKLLNATGRTSGITHYFKWLFTDNNFIHLIFGSFGKNHAGWAYEMVYGCVFIIGGIVGLVLFILPWIKSIRRMKTLKNNWIAGGIAGSLILYALISFVDGAYWLIPTSINFWMIIGLSAALYKINLKSKQNTM